MNELSRHQAAQHAFMTTVERNREALAETLRCNNLGVDEQASMRTLVRLARTRNKAALHEFETAVRASLSTYVAATPKAARNILHPDALFLLEHFDRFTEVPITPSPIQRVVIWARRNYRAWRKADEGHEH